jgi:hypothetical protein
MSRMNNDPKDNSRIPQPSAEFIRTINEDILEDGSAVIGGAQDRTSGRYIIFVHVPASAIYDGVGPEIFPTFDSNKYYVAFATELIYTKSEQIREKFLNNEEEINEALNEWLMEFVPNLFDEIDQSIKDDMGREIQ